MRKRAVLMLAIALAMMASLMVDVTCGSSGLPLSACGRRFPAGKGECEHVIVWDIRLPMLMASQVGAWHVGVSGRRNAKTINPLSDAVYPWHYRRSGFWRCR